jgi:galactokinase
MKAVFDLILSKGFSTASAQSKADLFESCLSHFESPDRVKAWFVPGRIEVLGKHTDYCGGRSVVAAVDQGIVVAFEPLPGRVVRVTDARSGSTCEFPLADDLKPTIGDWSNYPMTVARRVARDFPSARSGANIVIASDLVLAAGMSSSSALIIAIFLALSDVNSLASTEAYREELSQPTELASYVAAIEGGKAYGSFRADHGVGTAGGSEDHTAILCSQPGKLGVFSYRPVRLEQYVDFPSECVFVICSSGVVAEKTGTARLLYNRASELASMSASHAAKALGSSAEDLATLTREFPKDAIEKTWHGISESVDFSTRFRHFDAESNRIIPEAIRRLQSGDLSGWGSAVDDSQQTGERLLGNQVPETIYLAKTARELGAIAASAFGAGFGGSVWSMTRETDADMFIETWCKSYYSVYPQYESEAKFFATRPGPAAFPLVV